MITWNLIGNDIVAVKLNQARIRGVNVTIAVCGCPVCIRHGLKKGKWPGGGTWPLEPDILYA